MNLSEFYYQRKPFTIGKRFPTVVKCSNSESNSDSNSCIPFSRILSQEFSEHVPRGEQREERREGIGQTDGEDS